MVENNIEKQVRKFKDESLLVRLKAVEYLVQLGTPVVEPLINVLKDKDQNVREYAARTLGQLGDARAVKPLTNLLKDTNQIVRGYAAWALGLLGDPSVVKPLTGMLDDNDWFVRSCASRALRQLSDLETVEPIIPSRR